MPVNSPENVGAFPKGSEIDPNARMYRSRAVETVASLQSVERMRGEVRSWMERQELPRDDKFPGAYGSGASWTAGQMIEALGNHAEDIRSAEGQESGKAKEVDGIAAEMDLRMQILSLYDAYAGLKGDLASIAQLYIERPVTLTTTSEWQRLLSLPDGLGQKIDNGLRACLEIGEKGTEVPNEGTLNTWAYPREKVYLHATKEFVEKAAGDKSAAMWAMLLWDIWQEAAWFGYDQKRPSKLEGAMMASDFVKLMHFRKFSEIKKAQGAPRGGDLSIKNKTRPERLAVSFLRFLTIGEKENTRSVLELWRDEKKPLAELLGRVENLHAFRDYWLRLFFAGRKEGSLFGALTIEEPNFAGLISQKVLRTFKQGENIVFVGAPPLVTSGEFAKYFASNRSWADLEKDQAQLCYQLEQAYREGIEDVVKAETEGPNLILDRADGRKGFDAAEKATFKHAAERAGWRSATDKGAPLSKVAGV